jgi:GAF domain-containing protein
VADLRWSWLATPYIVCTAMLLAVAIAAALVRGDRVLRLGVISAAVAAVSWSLCQALAACTDDPVAATHLIRLGQGPTAAVGPSLMLVLLGVSGQLERYRWIARIAFVIGTFFFVMCWATTWTVPGVQLLPWGMFYIAPGPLTGIHLSLLLFWLVVGLVIARRASPRKERKRTLRILLGVLVITAIGSIDTLLLYRVWGVYPIAWLPATVASAIALHLVLRTDLLRPQGFDRGVAIELGLFLASAVLIVGFAYVLGTASPLPLVTVAAIGWVLLTGLAWAAARARPTRIKGDRELERFIARVPTFDDESKITEKLSTLWKNAVGIEIMALWWRDGVAFKNLEGTRWRLNKDVDSWLVLNPDPLAVIDLATMRLGIVRPKIEAFASAHDADLIVPLLDRDELVGLVEARYDKVLRESERALVADSARAAARALTFVGLARDASRERDTARQVEVADALRLQASASRDAELGRWIVAAEYRTAPRTTGAGWSAIELADGRLALLVTEAQAHGVAAALATAALTGAFAAATAGNAPVTLDDILRTMRASSEGVLRGGEPVAAFLAIVDNHQQAIDWACAGHPGACLVGPVPAVESSAVSISHSGTGPLPIPKLKTFTGGPRIRGASLHAARRGHDRYSPDQLLVVASTALRGSDDAAWENRLIGLAPASARLASVLLAKALEAGEPAEDLLAVVVRSRAT